MTTFECVVIGLLGYIAICATLCYAELARKTDNVARAVDGIFYRVFNIQARLKWEFPIGEEEYNDRANSRRAGWDPSQGPFS